MELTLPYATYEDCSVVQCPYQNGRPALIIQQNGEQLLKASVNMPDDEIPDGYVCIKDWSENEGVLYFLTDNGIVDSPEYFIQSGYCSVAVCKLLN